MKNIQLYKDFDTPEVIEAFTRMVQAPGPLFVARLGGSDYDIVVKYFNHKNIYRPSLLSNLVDTLLRYTENTSSYHSAIRYIKRKNGYFDFTNQRDNFILFLEKMIGFYKNADHFTFGGTALINKFKNNSFGKDQEFLDYIVPHKTLFNYTFIEAVLPFLKSFQVWGAGKKILIVSPFAKSLELQNRVREFLIKDYRFPNFQLMTYNTNITYSDARDTSSTLNVSTKNWHEECARINHDISKMDFDIALLSCASYSMSVGDQVKRMGKKAIYLGGILNVMFNIYGRRYDTSFFNNLVNLDYQIDPIENEKVISIHGGRGMKGESLNAYFGQRTKKN